MISIGNYFYLYNKRNKKENLKFLLFYMSDKIGINTFRDANR